MRDMLGDGERWLASQMRQFAAVAITYRDGDDEAADIPATRGRSEWNVEDAAGGMLRVEVADYIVTAADLLIDDQVVELRQGAVIEDGGKLYEVSPPGPGIPHWHWGGPARVQYRIHTKLIGPAGS